MVERCVVSRLRVGLADTASQGNVGASLLVALCICVWVAGSPRAAAQAVDREAPGPATTAVAAPVEQERAIILTGENSNGSTEQWERVEPGPVVRGIATSAVAELSVRNVSRATLTPFLPDPARASGAVMIVAPGGGFIELEMEREGYSIAHWLNERGIAAFVLKYRLAPTPIEPQSYKQFKMRLKIVRWESGRQTVAAIEDKDIKLAMLAAQEDGLEAIRFVRAHARQWQLSTDRIGFMGFSAGAITTVNVALNAHFDSRPDLIAPIYGSLVSGATVPSNAPPAFIAAATDDVLVPAAAALTLYSEFRRAQVSAELHVFEDGGHGFGMLRQGKSSDQWTQLFDEWLHAHGFTVGSGIAVAPR